MFRRSRHIAIATAAGAMIVAAATIGIMSELAATARNIGNAHEMARPVAIRTNETVIHKTSRAVWPPLRADAPRLLARRTAAEGGRAGENPPPCRWGACQDV